MKLKTQLMICLIFFASSGISAQTLVLSPELKELIRLSVNKDRKIAEKALDIQITAEQKKSVKSAYIPKLEASGKYVFAYSTVKSNIGEIEGFGSLSKLQEFMQNPAFPVLFPNLAGLSNEITQLQQLLTQQGMQLPSVTKNLNGTMYGNYFGLDATAKMLLFSGGQVPNVSKALNEKVKVQEAITDKVTADVITEVINCYDQLALLNKSKIVLNESSIRLEAERKYALSALNNGFATPYDTLRIAVAEARLQAQVAEYESKCELLNQKLSQLSGKPATDFAGINPGLSLLIYTDTSDSFVNRPEIRALDAGISAQKYMLKAAKSHNLPKVQALISARYDNIFSANADFDAPLAMGMDINSLGLGPTLMAGVGFKWELFDRSDGRSKVKVANLEVAKAENAKAEALELLQLDQTRAITTYHSSISKVNLMEKQKTAAKMALDLSEKSYQQGMISITERLAAETDMQQAELGYLQAVFAQRQAVIDCYKASGQLTTTGIY